jgi:hypothetical protein
MTGLVPNIVFDNGTDDFYISYNPTDIGIYGDVTTALVVGQMEHFYILNGNHCDAYKALLEKGFDACFAYFQENAHYKNKCSE